jgi:hypothetical protein
VIARKSRCNRTSKLPGQRTEPQSGNAQWWQAAVLQEFRPASRRARRDGLAWHDIGETDGGREFRFMKAIPTVPMCLACHGQAIAPSVAQKIAELYPNDKATGYSEGDIRGAFVVTRRVE